MKLFSLILVVLFLGSSAFAETKIRETSGVQIRKLQCSRVKDKIHGTLITTNDLGGANYDLKIEGEAHRFQIMCDVLKLIKRKNQALSLRISDSAEVAGSSTLKGNLVGIILPSLGD